MPPICSLWTYFGKDVYGSNTLNQVTRLSFEFAT